MEGLAPNSMQLAGAGSFTIGIEVENAGEEYDRLR